MDRRQGLDRRWTAAGAFSNRWGPNPNHRLPTCGGGWALGLLLALLLPQPAQANWLVRLLTAPPEMITAAVAPDQAKLHQIPGIEAASRWLYPVHDQLGPGHFDDVDAGDPRILAGDDDGSDQDVNREGRLPEQESSAALVDDLDREPLSAEDDRNPEAVNAQEAEDNGRASAGSDAEGLPPADQIASISRFRTTPGPVPDVSADRAAGGSPLASVLPDSSLATVTEQAQLSRTLQIAEEGYFSYTLKQEGVSEEDSKAIVASIMPHYDLRNVPKGTKLAVTLNGRVPAGSNGRLEKLYLAPDNLTKLTIRRKEDGSFQCLADTRKLQTRWVMARGSLKGGDIHSNAKRYNIPERIVANMIRAHRHWLNLEKSLSDGDQFSVLFEAEVDPKTGEIYSSGEILYTGIRYKGKKTALYWFEDGSNSNWYTEEGLSTKKGMTLWRKPIESGRMTSGFGSRRHPILKTRKMHWGTDYAAPTGTAIYAAGPGTVTFAGWKGGYGNHIEIKHNGTYSTTYSHMTRFAKNMKKGKSVSQGQIIGYVGTTGQSTGPHLHYEVVKNGTKVDPLGEQVPVPIQLSGSARSKFQQQVGKIDRLVANAMDSSQAKLR